MKGRAFGGRIVLMGNYFDQAPAVPGVPGSVTTRPFGSGGAEWNLVMRAPLTPSFFVDVENEGEYFSAK